MVAEFQGVINVLQMIRLSNGDRGQVEPSKRMIFILGQLGWQLKIGSSAKTGLNSEPNESGEFFWAWSVRCKSPPIFFMSKM